MTGDSIRNSCDVFVLLFSEMPVRKRTGGQVFAASEFIDLSEMRKYLDLDEEQDSMEMEELGETRVLYAGDPSDSDPGYEVRQIFSECTNV